MTISEVAQTQRQGINPGYQEYMDRLSRNGASQVTNPSGIVPTEYKVLIEPEAVADKVGAIFMPIETTDKQKYAQTRGRIVAVSPLAFTYATEAEWAAAGAIKPKVGDVVLYAKYAGLVVKGPKDGKEYTLANDKDICATIEE